MSKLRVRDDVVRGRKRREGSAPPMTRRLNVVVYAEKDVTSPAAPTTGRKRKKPTSPASQEHEKAGRGSDNQKHRRVASLPPGHARHKSLQSEGSHQKRSSRGRSLSTKPRRRTQRSSRRRDSADIFYEQIELIPKYRLNKTDSEARLDELARKRVARREYYGHLIEDRFREYMRNKKKRRGKRSGRYQPFEQEPVTLEGNFDVEEKPHTTASLPFDVTVSDTKMTGRKFPRIKPVAPLRRRPEQLTIPRHSRPVTEPLKPEPQEVERSAQESERFDQSYVNEVKPPSPKSDLHSDPPGSSAVPDKMKRHSRRSDLSNQSRAQHKSPWKVAEQTALPIARLKTLLAADLLRNLTPLRSRSDRVRHPVAVNINVVDSGAPSSDLSQRRKVVTSQDITPASIQRLRNLVAAPPGVSKPEDGLQYQKIYSDRRTARLAKIKGKLEAKKQKGLHYDPPTDAPSPRLSMKSHTSLANQVADDHQSEHEVPTKTLEPEMTPKDASPSEAPVESPKGTIEPSGVRTTRSEPIPTNVPTESVVPQLQGRTAIKPAAVPGAEITKDPPVEILYRKYS